MFVLYTFFLVETNDLPVFFSTAASAGEDAPSASKSTGKKKANARKRKADEEEEEGEAAVAQGATASVAVIRYCPPLAVSPRQPVPVLYLQRCVVLCSISNSSFCDECSALWK